MSVAPPRANNLDWVQDPDRGLPAERLATLIMLCGGIDSTYTLAKLLRETQDEILVHHVHFFTDTGRHVPEAESCKRIVGYCQNKIRPFFYSESAIDHRRFACHGYDVMALGLEAGMVAASFNMVRKRLVRRWTFGLAKDDEMPSFRVLQAERCCEWNCQLEPPHLFLLPRVDVEEEARYLAEELFSMTWSCRMPRDLQGYPGECGECKSCLRRARAARSVSRAVA